MRPQESPYQGSICAPASTRKSCRSELPRRMPCGTLIPQESRTLLSNQLAQGDFLK
ncbi:hypothetical protein [Pseudalkalibacillus sp. R45]|uniref:hypothetical protein n=1 Tax=Pseudalkalibacillus sp. R45 TaxID=3457433 RepID=UPI003FCCAF38